MKSNNSQESAVFEHRFWLQILGDHSRFIFNSLSPIENSFIQTAKEFIVLFDNLLEKSRSSLTAEELSALNYEAYNAAMKIREFKLNLLTKLIAAEVEISLPPTFFNHMLNELEDYIFILKGIITGKPINENVIHLHLLWLSDGAGHAKAILNRLDDTEKALMNKSEEYNMIFTDMYLKAIEFNGYTRTGLTDFPALKRLNEDAHDEMTSFKAFLKGLQNGVEQKKILGVLSPLVPDHMFREECYYLTKLSMTADTKEPGCNPAAPRVEPI